MTTRDWLIVVWLIAAVLGSEGIANDVLFIVLAVALFVENLLAAMESEKEERKRDV